MVYSWMEEPCFFATLWIYPADMGRFMQVTGAACKGEIEFRICSLK